MLTRAGGDVMQNEHNWAGSCGDICQCITEHVNPSNCLRPMFI